MVFWAVSSPFSTLMSCDLSSAASAAFDLSWWELDLHAWASQWPKQIRGGLLTQLRHLWRSFHACWLIFMLCFLQRSRSSSTWRTSPWMSLSESFSASTSSLHVLACLPTFWMELSSLLRPAGDASGPIWPFSLFELLASMFPLVFRRAGAHYGNSLQALLVLMFVLAPSLVASMWASLEKFLMSSSPSSAWAFMPIMIACFFTSLVHPQSFFSS